MARVIIQEPDADVRALIERLVSGLGHEAIICGVQCPAPPPADALVLEPQAGLDTAHELRRRNPDLPIVCVAVEPPSDGVTALGPDAFLIKPFGIQQFREALASALE